MMMKAGNLMTTSDAATTTQYLRFDRFHRILHGLLMLSFLGLAATGLPLLMSDARWASRLAHAMGGYAVTGTLHRTFAVLLIGVFVTHVMRLMHRIFVQKDLEILWGPASMVPQPRDIVELVRHMRWFLGLGPRPRFDHFTYWEKFDYWAVFWGMGIIGGSGLVLWFPELFSKFLPGWLFNIALLVHGEEALLAVGFIFTIHFFNGHLRPEKFPMDTVVFTGRISEHELKSERAVAYARMQREGVLEQMEAPAPTLESRAFGWFVGGAALALGVIAILLILYSAVTG